MGYLNYEFLDEYKRLDNICRDIYGETYDKKLGVTLYLEDMEGKTHRGGSKIPRWTSDYNRLKRFRDIRNELVHSRNSITVDICTQEDIDFVRSFRQRILDRTDPIAQLRKLQSATEKPKVNRTPTKTEPLIVATRQAPRGCMAAVVSCIIVAACVIAFLL